MMTHPGTHDARDAGLACLITALGREGFESEMLGFLRARAGVDLLSAFSLGRAAPPRMLLAVGPAEVGRDFPREASQRYAGEFWRDDPALPLLLGAEKTHESAMLRQPWDAIPQGAYRSLCYEQPRVLERLSSYCRPEGAPVLVNLYRLQDTGPFAPKDLRWIEDHAAVLGALVARHADLVAAQTAPALRPDAGAVACGLRARAPQLSAREAEICAGLLIGVPVKEVARSSNLGVSTVVTYKKRAYLKLGIATRHDLARIYTALGMPRGA